MASTSYSPDRDMPDLSDKVIFVTGGTAGLGAGSVQAFATRNPRHIYFSGRNQKSADALISKVSETSPNVRLTFIRCDVSSFASIQKAAREFTGASDRLDILIPNAGIMAVNPALSADGYETQFATNHLGHALLIKLLLPTMLRTAELPGADVRIINMSSIAYKQAPSQGIDFDTLKTTQSSLGGIIPGPKWSRYGQSKLANMLYADELAKRHPQITTVSVHPGYIKTGLFDNVPFLASIPVRILIIGKTTPVEQGHYNQVWAATVEKSKLRNGGYYEPVSVLGGRVTKCSKDLDLAERLWDWTQGELDRY